MKWKKLVSSFHQQESGQDLLEYALIVAAVLASVVAGSETVATLITDSATKVGEKILSLAK